MMKRFQTPLSNYNLRHYAVAKSCDLILMILDATKAGRCRRTL